MLNPAQKQRQIHELETALTAVKSISAVTDCRKCQHFNPEGYCESFDSKPPESFYLENCEQWVEGVPF